MFSEDQTAGRVVCLADYGRLKAGAIVPVANELYADMLQLLTSPQQRQLLSGRIGQARRAGQNGPPDASEAETSEPQIPSEVGPS